MLVSCRFFDEKVPNEKILLQKELKSINWNAVDEYPSIDICGDLSDKSQQKQCFFDFIVRSIQEKINIDSIQRVHVALDTLKIKVTISAQSNLSFAPVSKNDSLFNTDQFQEYLNAKLVDFPKINPAIKRAIPVKTEFVVPICLH